MKDYFYYRQVSSEIYDILYIGTSPYGKAICINIDRIKYSNLDRLNYKQVFDLYGDMQSNFITHTRLSPDSKDCWWWFRPTEEENKKVVSEILRLVKEKGEKCFNNPKKYIFKKTSYQYLWR